MKTLIVEDDFTSRLLMQRLLAIYGECHVAVNGKEAVTAFSLAREQKAPYDLICLDIMLPEVDGHEVLRQIRALEESGGTYSTAGVKIVMTTALGDMQNVMHAYQQLCDGYVRKPIKRDELTEQLRDLGLIS
jgi:two-component system, chemotaxis family, chemotaxis protein CheY